MATGGQPQLANVKWNQRHFLLVGDSRARCLMGRPGSPLPQLTTRFQPGARKEDIVRLVDEAMVNRKADDIIIIILGSLCDITYLQDNQMKLCTDYDIDRYTKDVVQQILLWQDLYPVAQIIWTIPYLPHFVRYNQTRAKTQFSKLQQQLHLNWEKEFLVIIQRFRKCWRDLVYESPFYLQNVCDWRSEFFTYDGLHSTPAGAKYFWKKLRLYAKRTQALSHKRGCYHSRTALSLEKRKENCLPRLPSSETFRLNPFDIREERAKMVQFYEAEQLHQVPTPSEDQWEEEEEPISYVEEIEWVNEERESLRILDTTQHQPGPSTEKPERYQPYKPPEHRKNLCNIVISESRSTETQLIAQNDLETTFYAPKKEFPLNKEKQNLNDSLISQTLKEEYNTNPAGISGSQNALKEKSSSPSQKRRKRSHSHPQQEDEEPPPLTSADKLQSIFKLAHIPISEEELNAYEQHNKNFISFLEPLGHGAEKDYITQGREALWAHKAYYKLYKKIPDLHPAFEEKYELFVKRFEEIYGKDYDNLLLQKYWKHFWDITINSIQDNGWKEKKKILQQNFKRTYAAEAAEIADKDEARSKSRHKSDREKGPIDTSRSRKPVEKPNHVPDDDAIFFEREGKEWEEAESEKEKMGKRKECERDEKKEQSKRWKVSPVTKLPGNRGGSEEDSIYQTLSVNNEFTEIYLESCVKLGPLDDSGSFKRGKATKRDPVQPREKEKPKIVFNLGRSKNKDENPKFSLEVALHYLETVSSKIGVMGPALLSLVETAKETLKNSPYKAYEIFADRESELLVNIAISKLKTLIGSSPCSEAEMYRGALPVFQKLLSEAKGTVKKPSSQEEKSTTGGQQHQFDIEAIARATAGFDAESIISLIKNTFRCKGLGQPSKEELHKVFKHVSDLHFQRLATS